ncbi:hypothetical protein KVV02_000341 [Mortierella alpina]|uniref:Alkaline phosphatase n=1 Tax=Mortierella alpina TaxID=64518 RepID=A0A9P8A677_MORAP|nr:hypothetical protein KVV02_000341 [Mortierella alpina]
MVRRQASAPLLANEDPRDSFDDQERELLQQEAHNQTKRERRRLCLCLGLAVVLASTAAITTIYLLTRKSSLTCVLIVVPGRSRNVIMMVSDGFGPASQTYGRSFWQYQNNYTEGTQTWLDEILVGASRTRSSNSLVTDSAAGATAFSCAKKSFNAAIAVDPEGIPCGTVLESAKQLGMLTGLVVTSRVTHATPAAFSAHVVHRDMESEIAVQQIGDYELGRQVDLMLGGGRCFFLPNTTEGSCRTDDRNLIEEAFNKHNNYGWKYLVQNRAEFRDLIKEHDKLLPLPVLGLFHPSHMNFEIDRNPELEPSLSEMAQVALRSLKGRADNGQGFFLMIEGSRIDMGAHNNDPVAHVHEILEYHRTIKVVRDFVKRNPDTIMISTSDHETGGFTLGLQPDPATYPDYLWRPEVIAQAKVSTEILTAQLLAFHAANPAPAAHSAGQDQTQQQEAYRRRVQNFIRRDVLEHGLGIKDPSEDEMTFLANPKTIPNDLLRFLGHAISRRANLGWTTMGHTGVDVNLYAESSPEGGERILEGLTGNHENTDIGDFMVSYLDLDLPSITERLVKYVPCRFYPLAHSLAAFSADKWFKRQRDFVVFSTKHSLHEETGH